MEIRKRIHKDISYWIYINTKEAKVLKKATMIKIDEIKFKPSIKIFHWRQLLNGTTTYELKIFIPMKIAKKLKLKEGQIKKIEVK